MVSSFTAAGAQVTTEALLEGAFDFILKPSSKDADANRRQLVEGLQEKIAAFKTSANSVRRVGLRERTVAREDATASPPLPRVACDAVVLGTSTGGPVALKTVLPRLPENLPVPVLVVQHMPEQYTRSLAVRLNASCPLEVVEATDGMQAAPGRIIIAAGGKQLRMVRDRQSGLLVRVTEDPPENGVRPSVDYLLRSVTDVLEGGALAVILTGMGRDGLAGSQSLKDAGGYVFAQSEEDAIVYGMPKAVIDHQLADRVLPLGKVAPAIVRHVKRSRRSASAAG